MGLGLLSGTGMSGWVDGWMVSSFFMVVVVFIITITIMTALLGTNLLHLFVHCDTNELQFHFEVDIFLYRRHYHHASIYGCGI